MRHTPSLYVLTNIFNSSGLTKKVPTKVFVGLFRYVDVENDLVWTCDEDDETLNVITGTIRVPVFYVLVLITRLRLEGPF